MMRTSLNGGAFSRGRMEHAARPKPAFILLTALLAVLLLVVLVGGAELYFRHLNVPPYWVYKPNIAPAVKESLSGESKGAPATHVPTHPPHPRFFINNSYVPPERMGQLNRELRFFSDPGSETIDPEVGNLPSASRNSHARAANAQGKTVYDVHYSIDEWNRRITPGQTQGKRDHALLFLGCSPTFGIGLNDSETLPAAVARMTRDFRVYNYAYNGWGPGNVLRRISKDSLPKEIPEKGGVAIYAFTDHHLHRMVGSLSLTRAIPQWRSVLPYYYLDGEGGLQSRGMLAEGRPVETWLFGLLAKSSVLSYFHSDVPGRFEERHFRLFVAMLQEMRRTLREKRNIQRFYVLFYPGTRLAKPLIHFLDEAGIPSIDYSELELWQYVEQPSIPGEFHPSAEAQYFLAQQLVRDLDLHRGRRKFSKESIDNRHDGRTLSHEHETNQ